MTKSKSAVDKYSDGEIEEQIKLAYQEWKMAQLTGITENDNDFIKNRLDSAIGNVEYVLVNNSALTVTISRNDENKTYYYNVQKGTVKQIELASNSNNKNDSYVGYFADIDEDGIVDGVIFADLLTGSIQETQKYGSFAGNYTLPQNVTTSNTRIYYISKDSYTDSHFKTHPVISPMGANGEKRFYIMSLSDLTNDAYIDSEDETQSYQSFTNYTWYKNATDGINASETSWNIGAGRTNTNTMINKWNNIIYGEHDNQDIWKHIQIKALKGWFIPSNAEWSAFLIELRNYNRKL